MPDYNYAGTWQVFNSLAIINDGSSTTKSENILSNITIVEGFGPNIWRLSGTYYGTETSGTFSLNLISSTYRGNPSLDIFSGNKALTNTPEGMMTMTDMIMSSTSTPPIITTTTIDGTPTTMKLDGFITISTMNLEYQVEITAILQKILQVSTQYDLVQNRVIRKS